MLEFLVVTNVVGFFFFLGGGGGFQADSRYSIGNQLCPLLADIFLYSYEADFALNRQEIVGISVQFTYWYIDDVLSINNPGFENYLGQMYPVELKSKTRHKFHKFISISHLCENNGIQRLKHIIYNC